jgi:hypothetical protein
MSGMPISPDGNTASHRRLSNLNLVCGQEYVIDPRRSSECLNLCECRRYDGSFVVGEMSWCYTGTFLGPVVLVHHFRRGDGVHMCSLTFQLP